MLSLVHKATVQQGRLVFDDPATWSEWLHTVEGKRVDISGHKERKPRTIPQNSYYRGVVVHLIASTIGDWDEDDTHDALRMMFLRQPHENGLPDTIRSTTGLSTAEMGEYIDKCITWAATFFRSEENPSGLIIPSSDQVAW